MTGNNKRFVTITDIDLEVSIKDNLTKKYPFSLCCENLDEFESLLNEVTNVCAEMNKAWEQTQRFEDHNKRLMEENEQLKQRCKELRNDLIDHSALIKMLEDTKALRIEDMIWNTMGYKTQTEFDDDFVDYREDAKKRWKK